MLEVVVCDPDPTLSVEIQESASTQDMSVAAAVSRWEEIEAVVARHPRAVIVVGPGWSVPRALEAMAAILGKGRQAGAVLLLAAYSSAAAEAAREAGFTGVLPVPVDAADLLFAIGKSARQVARPVRGQKGSAGRTILVFSTKGGVGKTVVATNLAATLATERAPIVRLLDLDLQFGDVGVMLKLMPKHTISDLVGLDVSDVDIDKLLTPFGKGVSALLAPLRPELADLVPAAMVKPLIRRLAESADFTIIDTPPCFNDHVLAALESVDEVLLVGNLDLPSVKNTKLCLNTLELLDFAPPKIRLMINKADKNVGLTVDEVETALGHKVITAVPNDTAVMLAVNKGVPVVVDRPKSVVSSRLMELATAMGEGFGRADQTQKVG